MACCICDPPTPWHTDPGQPTEVIDLSPEAHKHAAVSLEGMIFAFNSKEQ